MKITAHPSSSIPIKNFLGLSPLPSSSLLYLGRVFSLSLVQLIWTLAAAYSPPSLLCNCHHRRRHFFSSALNRRCNPITAFQSCRCNPSLPVFCRPFILDTQLSSLSSPATSPYPAVSIQASALPHEVPQVQAAVISMSYRQLQGTQSLFVSLFLLSTPRAYA